MVNVLAELLMAVSALQAGLVATAPSLVMIPRGEAIVRMSANVNTMESAIRLTGVVSVYLDTRVLNVNTRVHRATMVRSVLLSVDALPPNLQAVIQSLESARASLVLQGHIATFPAQLESGAYTVLNLAHVTMEVVTRYLEIVLAIEAGRVNVVIKSVPTVVSRVQHVSMEMDPVIKSLENVCVFLVTREALV